MQNAQRKISISATHIGINAMAAVYAVDEDGRICNIGLSLNEAIRTEYWLELLHESGYMNDNEFNSILPDCEELQKLLTAIINTAKKDQV